MQDGQGAEAEIFMNRASPLMHTVSEWSLQLRYSVTLARVLDSNRKFLDAAIRYFNLSNTQNKQVALHCDY
jgi:COP9 signalosome complex subunit 4